MDYLNVYFVFKVNFINKSLCTSIVVEIILKRQFFYANGFSLCFRLAISFLLKLISYNWNVAFLNVF